MEGEKEFPNIIRLTHVRTSRKLCNKQCCQQRFSMRIPE